MSKSSITFGILFSLGLHALVFWPQIQQAEVVLEMTEPDDPEQDQDQKDQRVAVRVMPLPIAIDPQPDPEPVPEQPQEPPAPEVKPEPAPELSEQLEAQPQEIAAEWQAEVPEEPQEVVAQAPVPVDEPPPDSEAEPDPKTRTLAASTPALQEVVKPTTTPATPAVAEAGRSTEPDDDALPTLRIEWSSARQLKNVARSLGMRIIAVDDASDIVGEVSLLGTPALVPFNGRLSNFSNRVRTLARNYFGPADRWEGGQRVAALWILVPASIDRSFANTQRAAIREAGRVVSDVRTTEGRFEAWADTYRLIITRVI